MPEAGADTCGSLLLVVTPLQITSKSNVAMQTQPRTTAHHNRASFQLHQVASFQSSALILYFQQMALSSGPKVVDNAIMLNTSLGTLLLTVQSRHTFAQGLWHRDFPLESFQLPNFESYFRYYRDQCVTALSDNPENPKSHREVIDIAQQLIGLDASSPSLSPVEKDGEERYWIYFAVRVLTMVDVGGLRQGLRLGQVPRMWVNGR